MPLFGVKRKKDSINEPIKPNNPIQQQQQQQQAPQTNHHHQQQQQGQQQPLGQQQQQHQIINHQQHQIINQQHQIINQQQHQIINQQQQQQQHLYPNANRTTLNNYQAPIYNPHQTSSNYPSNSSTNPNSSSLTHLSSSKAYQSKSPSISQSSTSTQSSTVIYPWSHCRLGLLPPAPFPADPSSELPSEPSALRPSPPPFPRYGHSINPMGTPNGSGDIYIFAGLVKDQVKNDLYVLNLAPPINSSPLPNTSNPSINQHLHNLILTVGLVETRGQIPPPRVGHASVGVGNVLIVWGGDTKSRDDEIQDDGLYLLNLSTREWTRVKVSGPCPEGRYGHSAAIIGSKFFIFAGQTDNGRFLNDLWSFDLHKLKSGAPKWHLNEFSPSSPNPSERTGHTTVTYKDSIFLFGGTDGQYHYNDTWKYDVSTGTWKELDCIGYIPLPREGHAATLVDDVMYVLGGRGVDGKDLDDLAAFKISNQRWYMFQNMGPAPAGRSGHSMASWQGKVYVLGGESYTSARPDDPSIVHVLDTAKIKYPQEPALASRQQNQISSLTHKPSDPTLNNPSPKQSLSMGNRATSNATVATAEPNNNQEPGSERNPHRSTTGSPSNPPTRPRRHDDPSSIASPATRRVMGPTHSRTNSPQGQVASVINQSSSRQSTSPNLQHIRSESLENSQQVSRSSQANPVAALRQSSSPVPRRVSAEITRMLHFTSSSSSSKRSMDITSKCQPKPSHQHSLSSSASSSSSPGPMTSAPAKALIDPSSALSKQNGWMKFALAMAVKQGFLPPSDEHSLFTNEQSWLMDFQKEDPSNPRVLAKDKGTQRLVEALVQLKRELVKAKNQVAEQVKYFDNRFIETNKIKTAALQEASFYRVKLAAYEASSVSEINKLERQRISDLEHRLSELITSKSDCERRIARLTGELEQERNLREISEENTLKSHERSEQLQALHSRMILDYQELLNRSRGLDMNTSDSMQQYQSLQSTHRQVLAELESSKQKLNSSELTNEKYLLALEHLQKVVEATSSKVDQVQKSWELTKHDLESQKSITQDLNRELDAKLQELQSSKAIIQEMEQSLKTMHDENIMLRKLNEQGISNLISTTRSAAANTLSSSTAESSNSETVQTRSLGADGPQVVRGKDEDKRQESQATQNLSRKQLETTLVELNEVRSRNMSLENDLINSNSEIASLRSKITNLISDSNKILAQISSKDHELQDKTRLIEAAEVKTSVLKNFLTESGLMGSTADDENGNRSFESAGPMGAFGAMAGALLSTSLGSGSLNGEAGFADRLTKRVQDLELQLDERSRTSRELELQYEETQKEMQVAEEKYREAHRKHEAAADEIASLVEEVQRLRSGGASSVSPASVEGHGKVEEELHSLQEKHRTLEQTHIKAVQYVKGTEKMLRRMKEELSKYKERTESLEAELSSLKRNELNESSSLNPQAESGEASNAKYGMTNEMKEKLKELTYQIENLRSTSRDSNLENEELQKKMNLIKLEYESDMKLNSTKNQVELDKLKHELKQSISMNQNLKNEFEIISNENFKLNQIILNSKNSINRVISSDEYVPNNNNRNHQNRKLNNDSSSSSGHSHLVDDQTVTSSAAIDSNSESNNINNTNPNPNQDYLANHEKILHNSQLQLDWLKKENAELQNRCRDAEAKISLLLDHMDNRSESNRRSTGLESVESNYSNSNYETNHTNNNNQPVLLQPSN